MNAWQVPHGGHTDPTDDQDTTDTPKECCHTVDFLRNATQEEESQHTPREDARQRPPRVNDAFYREHCNGHTSAQDAHAKTRQAYNGELEFLMLMMVLRIMMTQMIGHTTCLQEERPHVVRQDNRGCTRHAGRHRTHACRKDARNEQASKAYGQTIDDEVGEYVVGLGLNLCRQLSDASLIVAVEGRTNQEEQRRDGNEQIASEERRELRVLVCLRRMIALYVVLVDAIVLQIDVNSPNENLLPIGEFAASSKVCIGPSGIDNIRMPKHSTAPPIRIIPCMASAQMTAFSPPIIE